MTSLITLGIVTLSSMFSVELVPLNGTRILDGLVVMNPDGI